MLVVADHRASTSDYAIPNLCGITLPPGWSFANEVLHTKILTGLLRCIIDTWHPIKAVAESQAYRDKFVRERIVTFRDNCRPRVGWVTYLSVDPGSVPPLPPPARLETLPGGGVLVMLTDDRFTVTNPAHVETAQRVTALLDDAGLLEPLSFL